MKHLKVRNYSLSVFILIISDSAQSLSANWYSDRVEAIQKKNNCLIEYGKDSTPGYFLITPNYFIDWSSVENSNTYNLITLSAAENDDWSSCGEIIEVKERRSDKNIRIKNGEDPYGKIFFMYKFWEINSLNKNLNELY